MGAMNRYVTLQQLGDGTYGSVVLGQRVDTGEKVGFKNRLFFVQQQSVLSMYIKTLKTILFINYLPKCLAVGASSLKRSCINKDWVEFEVPYNLNNLLKV